MDAPARRKPVDVRWNALTMTARSSSLPTYPSMHKGKGGHLSLLPRSAGRQLHVDLLDGLEGVVDAALELGRAVAVVRLHREVARVCCEVGGLPRTIVLVVGEGEVCMPIGNRNFS